MQAEKTTLKNQPLPDYEPLFGETNGSAGKKPISILIGIFKGNRLRIFLTTALYVIKSCATWILPLVTANIINAVTYHEPHIVRTIIVNAIVIFAALIQNIPLHVLYSKYCDKMLRTVGAGLRNTMVKKLQSLSITYHKEIESGKLQSKFLRDIEAIEFFNNHFIKIIIPAVINIAISAGISISKCWQVAVFYALIIPVNVSVVYLFAKKMSKNNHRFRHENENVSANMTTMIEMIPVTKAHGLENEEIAKLEANIKSLREKGLILDRTNAYFGSVIWVISQSLSALCLIFTAFLAYKGIISVGDIVIYQNYFSSISGNAQTLVNLYPDLSKGLDSVKSVSEIVLSDKIEDDRNKIKLRYVHGSVSFSNVSYRYPNGDSDTIENFSLEVEPGECVAVVGASGSGKSTIMNMIIGFLQPTGGSLKIDGKPIETLNLASYRHFISVVPQNSILFNGTIKENITYGLYNVSEDELQRVVDYANITEFLDTLPSGLDTVVGEHGGKLSGGQKQRISIARALIRDPKILILDEATSALDNISEYHVQQAISTLIKGRTTFIVAHRLSTIRNADKIIVMDNGRIVEAGTFDELVAKKGHFYELKKLNDIGTEA